MGETSDETLQLTHVINQQSARMMQDYEFEHTDTSSAPASTNIQPSAEVVQNILRFARSYQTVVVDEKPIVVFLN